MGNREQTNNYILDGMDNNQIDNNDVAFAPSVDAIQEFNIISQNASAEFGNYIGGVIIVSTKSGGNQYHGNVFEFIRNDKLNANQWSNKINPTNQIPRALLRWNEFGASVGGPIKKDKPSSLRITKDRASISQVPLILRTYTQRRNAARLFRIVCTRKAPLCPINNDPRLFLSVVCATIRPINSITRFQAPIQLRGRLSSASNPNLDV